MLTYNLPCMMMTEYLTLMPRSFQWRPYFPVMNALATSERHCNKVNFMKSLMSCHRFTEVENSTSGGVTFTITGENRTWRVYILSRREVEGGGIRYSDLLVPFHSSKIFNILYISLNYLLTVKLHLFLIEGFFIGSGVTRSPALDPVSGV